MTAITVVLPDLELQVVAGEPATAVTGGGLSCYVPYDLDAIQAASLIIIPNWRDPAEPPPRPLLAALRAAHGRGTRVAGLCSGAFVLAAAGLLEATRLPVEEVARRCGFSSSAALRQHFRRVTGTAPAAYRATFGPRLETRAVLKALS